METFTQAYDAEQANLTRMNRAVDESTGLGGPRGLSGAAVAKSINSALSEFWLEIDSATLGQVVSREREVHRLPRVKQLLQQLLDRQKTHESYKDMTREEASAAAHTEAGE
jgi:hypothetical protein